MWILTESNVLVNLAHVETIDANDEGVKDCCQIDATILGGSIGYVLMGNLSGKSMASDVVDGIAKCIDMLAEKHVDGVIDLNDVKTRGFVFSGGKSNE